MTDEDKFKAILSWQSDPKMRQVKCANCQGIMYGWMSEYDGVVLKCNCGCWMEVPDNDIILKMYQWFH